jgi:hypothetical protein
LFLSCVPQSDFVWPSGRGRRGERARSSVTQPRNRNGGQTPGRSAGDGLPKRAHAARAFEIEDLDLDDLVATAMDDPDARTAEFRGLKFTDLHQAYKMASLF